jgi:hypothetical protein
MALATSTATAHIHVTVNTFLGETVIVAGYLDAEKHITIKNGYIHDGDAIAIFSLPNIFPSGELAGWYGGAEITLTSDWYAGAGHLNGGDFNFELADITPVAGDDDPAFAWVVDHDNIFDVRARTDGDSREDRSFNVGAGNHEHGQLSGLSHAGVYDITLIGWDANGVYDDSEPVKIRVNTSPAKGCYADLNGDGNLNILDFVAFQQWFLVQDPATDCNGDGNFNILDFVCFQQAFVDGCN